MWKFFTLSVLILLSSCADKKEVHRDISTSENTIAIGFVDSLYSNILHEERKVWIYIPNSFSYSIYTGQRNYPVAYLLDGNTHFHAFTGILEHLSEENGNLVCPDMMVVGILNTNRNRDFTPTTDVDVKESGGGEKFSEFIEKELLPHIDSIYHPLPFRMLVGHSYGGLAAINIMLHHAAPFNAFLAIDPSLSWDNQVILKQADTLLAKTDFGNKRLFIGIANTMGSDISLKRLQQDTSADNRHIRSLLTFVNYLKNKDLRSLRWDYNFYEDEDHYSVPIRAEYDALHFIFRNYPFTAYNELFDSTISTDSAKRIVTDHFQNLSSELGYRVLPPEHFINAVAGMFLRDRLVARSEAFYVMNVQCYPQSSNANKSMAEFYARQNEKEKAAVYFKQANTLGKNRSAHP